MTGSITMKGAGGLEAEVLHAGEDEVALGGGETGVLSERVVLKEGLRLKSGTGKRNRQILVVEVIAETLKMTGITVTLLRMVAIMMMPSTSRSLVDTRDLPGNVWFVPLLPSASCLFNTKLVILDKKCCNFIFMRQPIQKIYLTTISTVQVEYRFSVLCYESKFNFLPLSPS
jgi:hypothetical protein